MARKKIEIKDVTNERPVVDLNDTKSDIAEIKSLMKNMLENLQTIEDSLVVIKNKMTGGF